MKSPITPKIRTLAATALGLAASGFVVACAAATPAPELALQSQARPQPMAQAGLRLVSEHCSGCHAIFAEGDSPIAAAPPLRNLTDRYPSAALTEAFEQGLLTSHPSMPSFRFNHEELSAILAYLNAIQKKQEI